MLFRPEDKNFNWYVKAFTPVVKKFKSCFNGSEFMMISTADRAFRYNGRYESAHGIDSLIKVQATIAYNNNCCFYNQFESMGGKESIVRWADTIPSMANKDYVHPNFRGAELLGRYFFESLMKEYNLYSRSKK
jgi:lysophospholipase L1-like esterase